MMAYVFHAESVSLFEPDSIGTRFYMCNHFNNLSATSFFSFCSLAQRDGKPVSGQRSVSFLNNNLSPNISSSMNGIFHILMVSLVKEMYCFHYCVYIITVLFSV